MPRTASPETREHYAKIVQMRLDYPHLGDREIAARCFCSESTVTLACAAAGVIGKDNRRVRLKDYERSTISNLCTALGQVIAQHIQEQGEDSYKRLASNRAMINQMTMGLHDFTLLQIEAIAAWMQIPVSTLLRMAEEKLIHLGSISGGLAKS